jgi:probable addiction module antidote protein
MPKTRTKRWNPASQLRSEGAMIAYLEAALADGDPAVVTAALGDIARAQGMTLVARRAGLGRGGGGLAVLRPRSVLGSCG